jgi:hypothetical protein
MKAAKRSNLFKAESRIVDQPNGCGFRHQKSCGHDVFLDMQLQLLENKSLPFA